VEWQQSAVSGQHSAFSVQRSAFSVQRSAFSVQRSAFSVQRSAFSIQHSAFSIQHSAFSIQHSAFSIQHSAFSIQHSAFSIQHSAFSIQRSAFSNEQLVIGFRYFFWNGGAKTRVRLAFFSTLTCMTVLKWLCRAVMNVIVRLSRGTRRTGGLKSPSLHRLQICATLSAQWSHVGDGRDARATMS